MLCVAATNNCWCCGPASLSLAKDSPRLALADQGVLKWLTRKFWFETPKIIQIECLNVTVRLKQLSTELSRLKDLMNQVASLPVLSQTHSLFFRQLD